MPDGTYEAKDVILIKELTIVNQAGLHARAATQFVQTAARFQSDVFVEKDGQEVNGKSIMGVLLLVASQDSVIRIRCEGPDEQACMEALSNLVAKGFGEMR